MAGETKEKILRAAMELFASKGFEAVGIREIAKKAGVNSSLISYYFGGKANLYREVLFLQYHELRDFVSRASSVDEEEFLKGFVRMHVRVLRRRGKLAALLMHRELVIASGFGEELRERFLKEIGSRIMEVLKRAMDRGILKVMDPEIALGFLIHTDALFAVRFPHLEEEEAVRLAYQLFMEGMDVR